MSEGRPLPPGAAPPHGGEPPSDIGRLWRSATSAQRIGLGAFLLICVGLIGLAASLARHPAYAVLYANLDQDDAGEVVQHLRDLKVPYRVTARGTVEAPSDRIHELRLDLAAEGVPAGGQTGFELFDRTRLGISDFGEKLNFQRALQGELARTITHLDAVEQARVHIALPPERLYASEQQQPTASVVLKLRGSRRLSPAQVRSIVHLVSGAVEGLSPESVALLDTESRLLSNPEDSGPHGAGLAAASSQLQLRRDYERQVEDAVQSMLDGVLGPRKAVVRASAVLSFDSIEKESETFQPAGDGTGVLESRRETSETYRGLSEPPAAGVPGVTANTGVAPVPTAAASGTLTGAPAEADHYDHTEVTSQYRVSRQRERVIQPPGQLKQLSLSVFIDKKADLGEVDDLSAAVAAAAGLDPDRGDTVVITRVPFQPPPSEEQGSKAFAIRDFYYRVGRDFAAIVLMVLFLRFALGPLLRELLRRRAETQLPESAQASRSSAARPAAAPVPAIATQASGPDVEVDPDRAAAVLKTWLSADHPSGRPPSPGGDGQDQPSSSA
ncbi:MAG: flagellar M-ring protein FliF [Armatimonadota bacterium]|nr:MAG: flagellar M-ring protein FliF [Armatimonadota bacterium]